MSKRMTLAREERTVALVCLRYTHLIDEKW
ncbi:hypothetical protein FHS27_003983 [Rhodopirellula rubra]|uniref:Uncharacterized protein n=1 Tax=Aporhodopirellula rubra TaxID=980271 RepID=A0A7W5E0Z8_9BACT|nr:hypothetical protein [Aporhodopirellula rubra]